MCLIESFLISIPAISREIHVVFPHFFLLTNKMPSALKMCREVLTSYPISGIRFITISWIEAVKNAQVFGSSMQDHSVRFFVSFLYL
jgi:hypothetical protein